MLTVRFYQKPSNGSIHMTIKGHAESAPKGEDLICSAATMLAYMVAQAVQFMYENEQLKMRLLSLQPPQKKRMPKHSTRSG